MQVLRFAALFAITMMAGLGLLYGWVQSAPRAAAAAPKAPPPPEVTVTRPLAQDVTEFLEFPGRTAAVELVELRARVSGYVQKIHFKDGSDVKAGDLLYEIDPAPYEAALAQAQGVLASSAAKLRTQQQDLARFVALSRQGGVSREQVDQATGAVNETTATLQSLQAGVDRAKLELSYTKVTAPISGLIGRARVTPGNAVTANQTVLTTIVTVDPVYAYFDVDEATVLRARKMIRERKITDYRVAQLAVSLNLAGEIGFPHQGTIDFAENALDAGTGTLNVRGVFANADRAISAGMFVRVRFPLGGPRPALLVPDRALSMDQRGEFLKIVGPGEVVEDRPITTGRVEDGMVLVESGLHPNERVIVKGLQRARAGSPVKVAGEEKPATAKATRQEPGTGAGMEGGPRR